jgi:hypothetical protein
VTAVTALLMSGTGEGEGSVSLTVGDYFYSCRCETTKERACSADAKKTPETMDMNCSWSESDGAGLSRKGEGRSCGWKTPGATFKVPAGGVVTASVEVSANATADTERFGSELYGVLAHASAALSTFHDDGIDYKFGVKKVDPGVDCGGGAADEDVAGAANQACIEELEECVEEAFSKEDVTACSEAYDKCAKDGATEASQGRHLVEAGFKYTCEEICPPRPLTCDDDEKDDHGRCPPVTDHCFREVPAAAKCASSLPPESSGSVGLK